MLPALVGAKLARGSVEGPYASWDVEGQGALALIARGAVAHLTGGEPATGDRGMLVSRVADVDAGYALCLRHGGVAVAGPAARPEWGPTMRTAHLRDPDGNLWELQSY